MPLKRHSAAFSTWMASRAGKSFDDYEELAPLSRSPIPPSSGRACGTSPASSATRASRPISSTATGCRARASFPTPRLNFAENLLRKDGAGHCAGLLGRGQGQAPHELGRAARRGGARQRGAARGRRRRGRPRGRHPAQHAREHRRRARRRLDRRGVVVLLARLRRAGRARPLRADRAEGADRLRRLLLRRQDASTSPTSSPQIVAKLPTLRAVIVVPYLGHDDGGGAGPQRRPDPQGAPRADLGRCRRPHARPSRCASSACRSRIRSTCCSRRAPPACPSASCIRPAARC